MPNENRIPVHKILVDTGIGASANAVINGAPGRYVRTNECVYGVKTVSGLYNGSETYIVVTTLIADDSSDLCPDAPKTKTSNLRIKPGIALGSGNPLTVAEEKVIAHIENSGMSQLIFKS